MTWKDKLEIGLKDDAPFRRDNLPDFQKKRTGGSETKPGDPTRSPEEPGAREDAAEDHPHDAGHHANESNGDEHGKT